MNIKARQDNLVTQSLNSELLVYDLNENRFFSLNPTSAFIWQNLDGKTSVAELSHKANKFFKQTVNEDFIWLAIDELQKCNLLEHNNLPEEMSKVKRREAIKKIGLASLIALPVVSSLIAPTAAHAASLRAACQTCTSNADCLSNKCVSTYFGNSPSPICSVGTDSSAHNPGLNMNAAGNAQDCQNFGIQFCCSGSATFISSGNCPCN